jgi:short-subunit dehydrogenase
MTTSSPRRTALVTGASSGVGRAIALEYATRGFDLVVTARRLARLEELAAEATAQHGSAVTTLMADLGAPEGPAQIAAELDERGITVDVLVNNAGAAVRAPFLDRPWAEHASTLQLMFGNPAQLIYLLLPGMLERGYGRVINIASLAAVFPGSPYTTTYAPTKSGLVKLTEGLVNEYGGRGVHFTVSLVGMVDTEMLDSMGIGKEVRRAPKWVVSSPALVARQVFEASERGRVVAIDRPFNRATVAFLRHYPLGRGHRLMDYNRGVLKRMGLGESAPPTDLLQEPTA